MGLTVQGGPGAFIEVADKPLKSGHAFRIDTSEVVSTTPVKGGAARQTTIAIADITGLAHWGSVSGGDQRRYTYVIGSAAEMIRLEWTSYSWFTVKTAAQKDGARLWQELTMFSGRIVTPAIAGIFLRQLQAGEPAKVAGFTLTQSGISGKRRKEQYVFTPWTEVSKAVITGTDVDVLHANGKGVLYRVSRSHVNAVVLPLLVTVITEPTRS